MKKKEIQELKNKPIGELERLVLDEECKRGSRNAQEDRPREYLYYPARI
jgi:hypothetical protein